MTWWAIVLLKLGEEQLSSQIWAWKLSSENWVGNCPLKTAKLSNLNFIT